MKWNFLCFLIVVFGFCPLFAQSNIGELRLQILDPAGLGVQGSVELISEANQFRQKVASDLQGTLTVQRIPFGVYRLEITQPGFAAVSELIEIRTSTPAYHKIQLQLPGVTESVIVDADSTLIDPDQAGSVNRIGSAAIQDRLSSLPGRSLQDLVNSQPGWVYEGNAVLHPRGSEYQTQFVIDGIPLTDNRSPGFGPEIEADDVESLTVFTAGIPAEYGRKMGGVIEVNTLRNNQPGAHGGFVFWGGSFDTAGGSAHLQDSWGQNAVGISAAGSRTAHYLNPVVPENYTNKGTTGSFSLSYGRGLTHNNRLTLIARHELARYQIPNEEVQQNGAWVPGTDNTTGCPFVPVSQEPSNCVFIPGGQQQTGDNFETMGSASYQHIFSANKIVSLRGMVRDNSNDFYSNPSSWPLIATQHNDFKEIYFSGNGSIHKGKQEWKAGLESDAIFLNEDFSYVMPNCADPSDPQCPITLGIFDAGATSFAYTGSRPDLEQSAYVQDLIRLGNWTVNAGLRWDHYQLLLNQNAVSPRVALSRYFPKVGLDLHGSYDRIFQTPSFENILLSSSVAAESLDTSVPVVQLPVQPSHGSYYELGLTKALFDKLRVDANLFRRDVNNYADDSQILSTGISFPLAFKKGIIYGAEGKLEVQHWGRFSGFASYSYIVGNVWNPVTGGLLLGDDASSAVTELSGHSPDSQDQRQTVRARVRYQVVPRLWIALGSDYNSGLPFQPDLTPQQYAAEYGQVVINHLNFDRGRISPYLTGNASVGADLCKREKYSVKLQADIQNLSNKLEVIDFGGLFSGNAIAPSRSGSLRLKVDF
jgi:hypothetical protein